MLFPATWSLEKSAPEEEVEDFLPAATAATLGVLLTFQGSPARKGKTNV